MQNRKAMCCPVCGAESHSYVYCWMHTKSICWAHCNTCRWFEPGAYSCNYKLTPQQAAMLQRRLNALQADRERRLEAWIKKKKG